MLQTEKHQLPLRSTEVYKMAVDKNKALETALTQIEKQFGKESRSLSDMLAQCPIIMLQDSLGGDQPMFF